MFKEPSGITAALPAQAPDGTYAIQTPFRYALSTPIA
jgi:hypothetical protein